MFEFPNFSLITPELFLLGMSLFILGVDLIKPKENSTLVYLLSELTLCVTAFLCFSFLPHTKETTFSGHFVLAPMGSLIKGAMDIALLGVLVYSQDFLRHHKIPQNTFCLLSLFALLGGHALVSAGSFVTLYLGLELFSLPLYALIALKKHCALAAEGAMKYFIMGSLASGLLLYGFSMVYGATQALDMQVIFQYLSVMPPEKTIMVVFGMVFVIVGIAFKLGMVPFHMWVPDVYEGSPSALTLLIATVGKIVALGLGLRILVDLLPYYHHEWQPMVMAIALLSIGLGNMVAIVQVRLKRLLAYSSIAHMGYLCLGLIAGTASGYGSTLFYMLVYVLMSLGAFGMITLLNHSERPMETLDDFKGLHHRNPWLAFIMLIMMFSMAGVPPTVGFFAKMAVLEALIRVHLVWLAVFAIVFAIVGAYYYLQVVKVIYFDKPKDPTPLTIGAFDKRFLLSVNGIGVLALGLFPSQLFMLCQGVF